jgi:hypothetical protein
MRLLLNDWSQASATVTVVPAPGVMRTRLGGCANRAPDAEDARKGVIAHDPVLLRACRNSSSVTPCAAATQTSRPGDTATVATDFPARPLGRAMLYHFVPPSFDRCTELPAKPKAAEPLVSVSPLMVEPAGDCGLLAWYVIVPQAAAIGRNPTAATATSNLRTWNLRCMLSHTYSLMT